MNLFCQNNDSIKIYNDTTSVTIPTYILREANNKLIERKYYILLNAQKDSIILLKDEYIEEQKDIIDRISVNYNVIKKENKSLRVELNNQKKATKIYKNSLFVTIIVAVCSYFIIK